MNISECSNRFDRKAIASRLDEARREISFLSKNGDVKLLAVTKTVPVDIINYAIDELGITAIGENRVQELMSKHNELHSPSNGKLEIHFIGSLQTNKVKYIIDKVDMIESVDSIKLAAEIDKQAKKHSRKMDILIEVNSGREKQKGGVFPEDAEAFANEISQFTNLTLRGLMTVAPRCEVRSEYFRYFEDTRQLFLRIKETREKIPNVACFDVLSMGMSESFREAILRGSTEVRLGSTIFGSRPYPVKN